MGVLNLTPDSFSDGGRLPDDAAAIAHGVALVAEGAAILDVGAVSSRPGAPPVPVEEEWRRLAGVLAALHREVDVPVSLDTSRAEIVRRALELGAVDLVNDISALGDDPALAPLAAEAGLPVVLMHRRGTPADMQADPSYADAPAEVLAELSAAVRRATAAGLPAGDLLLDPGIGFGKRLEHNLALLAALPRLVATGHRTVLGCSRKAFLGALTGAPVGEREHATTATTVLGALAGIDFLRVHDVRAARQALAVVAAVRGGDPAAAPLT
jgi:dihydropteroate synthase